MITIPTVDFSQPLTDAYVDKTIQDMWSAIHGIPDDNKFKQHYIYQGTQFEENLKRLLAADKLIQHMKGQSKTGITPGNWSVGKLPSTIISDTIPENYPHDAGRDSKEYYGGFLIAESIQRGDAIFLAQAKNLLLQAALVVNDVNRSDLQSVQDLKALINQFI